MYLHCRFVLFWRKEIGAKAARKMLVNLTEGEEISGENIQLLCSEAAKEHPLQTGINVIKLLKHIFNNKSVEIQWIVNL